MITQNKNFAWNHKPETELMHPTKGIKHLLNKIGINAHIMTIQEIQRLPRKHINYSFTFWKFIDCELQKIKYKELAPNYSRKKQEIVS